MPLMVPAFFTKLAVGRAPAPWGFRCTAPNRVKHNTFPAHKGEVLRAPQVLVPLMVAVLFAKLVGDALGLSVYDTHIKIKGCPVLVRMLFEHQYFALVCPAQVAQRASGLVQPIWLCKYAC